MYLLLLILLVAYFYFDYKVFNKCGYSKETNLKYRQVRFDTGLYGEYLTYKALDKVKGEKKILANIYIPKKDGKTTELDLLMIHESGLYCIESKNYSGWIFGNEKSRYWTQTLKNRQKNKFYNPIMQNAGHINALKDYLGGLYNNPIISVIVFSERCTLKKINIESKDIILLKRDSLTRKLNKAFGLSETVISSQNIDDLYNTLKLRTQVSEVEKQAHIADVRSYQ